MMAMGLPCQGELSRPRERELSVSEVRTHEEGGRHSEGVLIVEKMEGGSRPNGSEFFPL
jgi:hypothetical protein